MRSERGRRTHQSKQSENMPSPSLPFEPPKMRVNQGLLRLAKQKMETPVRVGATNWGIHSQQLRRPERVRIGSMSAR